MASMVSKFAFLILFTMRSQAWCLAPKVAEFYVEDPSRVKALLGLNQMLGFPTATLKLIILQEYPADKRKAAENDRIRFENILNIGAAKSKYVMSYFNLKGSARIFLVIGRTDENTNQPQRPLMTIIQTVRLQKELIKMLDNIQIGNLRSQDDIKAVEFLRNQIQYSIDFADLLNSTIT